MKRPTAAPFNLLRAGARTTRRFLMLMMLAALPGVGVAEAKPLNEIRLLTSVKKFSGANLLATTFETNGPRLLGSNHLETSIGLISRADDHRPFLSVGPVWRIQSGNHAFFLDLGISPTLMAGSHLGHREMGGSFFFSLSAAAGWRARNGWAVAARLQPISNGGLHSTNPGLDLFGLSVVRSFEVR